MELHIQRSQLQITLESNGCAFKGQELLENHEANLSIPCYCGRPNKPTKEGEKTLYDKDFESFMKDNNLS